MNLQSKRELELTRKKLQDLERLYAETEVDPTQGGYSRELTLRSLRQTANQLKEEIARFEAHAGSMATDH
ncbi:MAG: hypothetical protein K8T89_23425 [Planctomycetes bacterium]|nr:hypothetical protein [Planctomycetota bacterium]